MILMLFSSLNDSTILRYCKMRRLSNLLWRFPNFLPTRLSSFTPAPGVLTGREAQYATQTSVQVHMSTLSTCRRCELHLQPSRTAQRGAAARRELTRGEKDLQTPVQLRDWVQLRRAAMLFRKDIYSLWFCCSFSFFFFNVSSHTHSLRKRNKKKTRELEPNLYSIKQGGNAFSRFPIYSDSFY